MTVTHMVDLKHLDADAVGKVQLTILPVYGLGEISRIESN